MFTPPMLKGPMQAGGSGNLEVARSPVPLTPRATCTMSTTTTIPTAKATATSGPILALDLGKSKSVAWFRGCP